MSGVKKADVRPIDLPKGRRVLVVSDIHGNLPILKGALAKTNFCADDILIILGDILERNTGSLETLRYVMDLCEHYTVYPICGNCDELFTDFMEGAPVMGEDFFPWWFSRLGERSVMVQMARLAGVPLAEKADFPAARAAIAAMFPKEVAFLESLPNVYMNDDYLFVHGGVPREDDLASLTAHEIMKNDNFMTQGHSFRRWVIVGHWPVTLYHTDYQTAAPVIDAEHHIISIDGGCTLKADGQLNVLILPETPDGAFNYVAYDGFPVLTALDDQAESPDPLNIRWGRSDVEVLERGEELCRCRHLETGREIDILTDYLRSDDTHTWCEDSTDYRLPVTAGERLSVVRRLSDRALGKRHGVTGWYFGRLSES